MEVRELKKKTNRNRRYWKYPTSEFETNVAGLCEDSYPIFIYGNIDATWREKKKKKRKEGTVTKTKWCWGKRTVEKSVVVFGSLKKIITLKKLFY